MAACPQPTSTRFGFRPSAHTSGHPQPAVATLEVNGRPETFVLMPLPVVSTTVEYLLSHYPGMTVGEVEAMLVNVWPGYAAENAVPDTDAGRYRQALQDIAQGGGWQGRYADEVLGGADGPLSS